MKVLSIGNSFSSDAHGYHKVAKADNYDMKCVNLYRRLFLSRHLLT